MEEKSIQLQVDEINRKLDIILEEIELQRRHRREMDDLKDDLMRVGKDVYQSAVRELEEIHEQVETGDVLYLVKKLLRNINNITKTFEIMEGMKDFVKDFAPVYREITLDIMARLDELDRKGYFVFMRELSHVADKVVTSFSSEDIKNLGESIVTILNTVKNLTQPEMLHAINNAVTVYKNLDIEVQEKVSLLSLVKELNNPEVRKGLAFGIRFLKTLAQQEHKPTQVQQYTH